MADKLAGNGSSLKPRGGRKAIGKALVAIATMVVMVVAVGGVFYLAGGANLVANAASPPPPVLTAVASTLPTLPAGVDETLANRMYAEQVESHANLTLLAQGKFTRFTIDKVKVKGDSAWVNLSARLADGTSAPGILRLTNRAGKWYLHTVTGLRPPSVGGLASYTDAAKSLQPPRTPDVILADSGTGVMTFDEGVVRTIASEQGANQDVVASIMDGSVKGLVLGKPDVSVNSVSVPITFSGSAGKTKGTAVLIQKTIDGVDLDFLTSFTKS